MADTFKFDTTTPAAVQLVEQTFAKLKEVYDPGLTNDAAAQYAVALVAKGWERKKVLGKLKELLDEEACNMLLDWLMPQVRIRRKELTASKAPSKPAGSSTTQVKTKKEPTVSSKAQEQPATALKPDSGVKNEAPVKPEPAAQPSKQEPIDDVEALLQEELPSDLMSDLEGDDEPQPANDNTPDTRSHPTSDRRDSDAQPAVAAPKPDPRDNQPAARGQQEQRSEADRPSARRKHEPIRPPPRQPAAAGPSTAPQADEPQRRSRVKSVIQWPQPSSEPNAPKELASPGELRARRERFGDVRPQDSRDGNRDGERARDHAHSRGGAPERARSRSPVGRGRQSPPGRRDAADAHGHNAAQPHNRPRLRSVVSGGLDEDAQDADQGGPGARKGSVFARLFKGVLGAGQQDGPPQRAPKAIGSAVLRVKRTLSRDSPQPGGDDEHMNGDDRNGAKNVFDRLARARSNTQQAAGAKRPLEPGTDSGADTPRSGADGTKVQRTGSAVMSGVRGTPRPGPAGRPTPAQVAAAAAAAAAAAGQAAAVGRRATQEEKAQLAAQVPLLAGVRGAAGTSGRPMGSAVLRADAKPFAPGAAPAGAAVPKPAAAAAAGAGGAKPKPAAAAGGAQSEMAKLKAELARKALEIERMKGQIALKEVVEDKQGSVDARSVLVQSLHPAVNKQLLQAHFRDCGTILNVNIVFDNFTGMICAAYIEFDTLQAQQTALKKDRSLLLDQVIIVKPKPVTKRPAAAAVPAPGAAAAATRAAPARLADAPPLPGKAAKTWVRPTGPAAQPTTG